MKRTNILARPLVGGYLVFMDPWLDLPWISGHCRDGPVVVGGRHHPLLRLLLPGLLDKTEGDLAAKGENDHLFVMEHQ